MPCTMPTLALACALLCAAMAPVSTSTPTIKQLAGTWRGDRSVAAYTVDGEGQCVDANDLEAIFNSTNLDVQEDDALLWDAELVVSSGGTLKAAPIDLQLDGEYEPLLHTYNATVTAINTTTGEAAVKFDGGSGCVRFSLTNDDDVVMLTEVAAYTVSVYSGRRVKAVLDKECPAPSKKTPTASCESTEAVVVAGETTEKGDDADDDDDDDKDDSSSGKAPKDDDDDDEDDDKDSSSGKAPKDYTDAFQWCLDTKPSQMSDDLSFQCLSLMMTGLSGVSATARGASNEVAAQLTQCAERFATLAIQMLGDRISMKEYRKDSDACLADMQSFFEDEVASDSKSLRDFCGTYAGLDCALCAYCADNDAGSCNPKKCTSSVWYSAGDKYDSYDSYDLSDLEIPGYKYDYSYDYGYDYDFDYDDVTSQGIQDAVDDALNNAGLDDLFGDDLDDLLSGAGRRLLAETKSSSSSGAKSSSSSGDDESDLLRTLHVVTVTQLECVKGACEDL